MSFWTWVIRPAHVRQIIEFGRRHSVELLGQSFWQSDAPLCLDGQVALASGVYAASYRG